MIVCGRQTVRQVEGKLYCRTMTEFEPGNEGWEESPDLTESSETELHEQLEQLVSQEREISYRRRLIQGRIDLIRAELVRRGGMLLSPEQLARILMGETTDTGQSPGEQGSDEEGGS